VVTNFANVIEPLFFERTSRGLADAMSKAIGDGSFEEGTVLPPIRDVATALALSPSTVSVAWKLLAQAGAIQSDGRRGTTVLARRGPGPARYRRALEHTQALRLDLSTGVPDNDLLPDLSLPFGDLHHAWASGSYLDDPIIPGLVDALRSDWPYDTGDFMVVDGAMDALDQVASFLLRYGDLVVVEDPSFPPMLDLLDSLGVRTVGVEVDEQGLVVDALAAVLVRHPKAVFIQPRAHNPTGASMSKRRAAQLASLLRGSDIMVVEDDSVGAVASTPPISLGAWLPDQTVHIRSFSKSHGPDLRLAALSGPADLVEGLRERRLLGQGWTSRLLQAVLVDLLSRSASRARIDRARDVYARRRGEMNTALAKRGVRATARDGLNLWLPVRNETAALLFLASHGIGAAAGSPFATTSKHDPHLRVTIGLVSDGVSELADLLATASRFAPTSGPR
jgi:DNA-binding transcriptional MocR family regulator